ncbi:MAG: RagB/SusD family nutrient uptake outer membrane protein [Chitinophagaceae bacterium]|nr:MAG: RagB/SusD family nutrient uptake outer membrane protein [Chitinophagaceae bacterium]
MKNKIKCILLAIAAIAIFAISSCSKLLDKMPVTQVVTKTDTTSITAADAENLIAGCYDAESGYAYGLEFNVLDRITNGDVRSDNCYAGGDNPDNISIDLFTDNALNGNIARDWSDAYGIIGVLNIAIAQVENCTDPALSQTRKNQILGEARFMRAFTYFDLVRLYGRVPIMLKPVNQTNSESLIKSTLVPQSSVDSVYQAILNDLWFAKQNVQNDNVPPNKMIVTKGAVNSILAKVYATMSPQNWDSVAYYCDQVIPDYALVSNYNYLWDNQHKNNSEAIWEFNYVGYSVVGNWIPSQFIGAGWKKFETPTNDLVNDFEAEHDIVRMNASISFVNYGWADPYWKDVNNYPIVSKYNDPNNGTNDFYQIRLADILLLRAKAYNELGDINNAAKLVDDVRARVKLPPTTANTKDAMAEAILNERRLELAFEGQRWFDLLRTGNAVSVMNAGKDGNGNNLNYNVQPYMLVYPIPQTQLDLNPLLTQNAGY